MNLIDYTHNLTYLKKAHCNMDMVKKPSSLASGYGNSFAPIDD